MWSKVIVSVKALRPFSFTASIVSVCLAAAVCARSGNFNLPMFIIMLAVVLCLHMGTNLSNDYFDFKNGIDIPGSLGSSGMLTSGRIKAKAVLRMMIACFGLALILGTYIVFVRGWPAALLGIIGIFGGFFYTAPPLEYKYYGWGDFQVFILMGPLLVFSSCFVISGVFDLQALWLSVPVGLLVMAVLVANNIRDFDFDRKSGIQTFALLIGLKNSLREYKAAVIVPFFLVSLLAVCGGLNFVALFVWLTLPVAVVNIKKIKKNMLKTQSELKGIDAATAGHHLLFGLIIIISILVQIHWK